MAARKRRLMVVYDVTGFTDEQIAGLAGEAIAKGEESEQHPTAPLIGAIIVRQKKGAPLVDEALRAAGVPA